VSGNTPTVVWLDRRIPVHIAYWTVVGEADGSVRYLHDLYRRDGRLIAAYAQAFATATAAGEDSRTGVFDTIAALR